ncbi:hypothetical protein FZEAL_1051 [Fusarium zealandicum]|uniref:Cytochrome b5 heme-binding domain-containing protein n=1 Tax=Fusarium zealandicum TaxID=1053134 RepID=A0A8H4UU66_9HYPO|nr:hypothetical protein FZEAL_1051 [Fusarium zealandicum]
MDHVERQMAQQANQNISMSSLLSPLNLMLFSAVVSTAYALLPFNGEGDRPVYLAVRGRVFDVSRGRNFYGPGGPYSNFAGRDASRGLACGSFDEDMLTEDLDGPLDKLDGLDDEQLEALQGWEERFLEKYDVVGRLVSAGDFKARKA